MQELAHGSILSGYRIEGVVGRGGMGVVYRAEEIALGRTVALKVIAPELLDDRSARERFLREARAAASIEHPHVIPLLHAGDADGTPYLVMRFVDGDDVRTLVRRAGALAPDRAAAITAQAGDALDAIHAAGLVHRDIKPANVLLGPRDHVYVTDFGLAKNAVSRSGHTRSGQWVGTLDFVAPEQIRGERVDARTDVYALGGLLFYMLSGAVPFAEHEGDEAKLWAQLTAAPRRLSAVRPDLPPTFDTVLARAMAKDSAERYPSTGDLGRAALAAARGEDPPEAERTVGVGAAAPGPRRRPPIPADEPTVDLPRADRPARGGRRPRWVVAGVALAAIPVIAAATVLLSGSDPEPNRGRPAAASAGVRVGATIERVGRRPNAIAVAGGSVWVSSAALDRITRLDATSGRRLASTPAVGRSIVGLASAGDTVWAALARPGRLVRLDADGLRRTATARLPGNPTALDATADAVWVAVRGGSGAPDVVLRYDPATRRRSARVAVESGARALAAAPAGVWVAHRTTPTVAFIDGRTRRETLSARLRQPAYDLTYGAGYAWASLRTDDSVARIDPRGATVVSIAAPRRPMQGAVAGDRVFVAGFADHTVGIIDPRAARQVGRPLAAGLNPFAVTGDSAHVWVTAVGTNSVTRLDLE
ncbi:MAG TPA: protein kinase [Solirubrobacteraceae bacterium]|nr:protein kinase [Solirubrobacteraceae bacterium]